MTVFKRPKKNDLFATKRACLQDGRLSNAARGLLALMLSMPHDWDFYQNQITATCQKDGKDAIRSQMKELVCFGYLIKHPRKRVDAGQWGKIEYEIYDEPQIKEILSNESVDKIFSFSFSTEDFQIIYHKSGNPTQAESIQVNPSLEYNKEQLPKVKETNKPEAPVSPSTASQVVCSFKDKILEKTQLTGPQQMKIKTQFAKLDDKTFEESIKAFLIYSKENEIGDHMATIITALGGKDGIPPWKTKTKEEDRAEENKKKTIDTLGKYDNKLIGNPKFIEWRVNVCNKYLEFTSGSQNYVFDYTKPDFVKKVNGILEKSRIDVRMPV